MARSSKHAAIAISVALIALIAAAIAWMHIGGARDGNTAPPGNDARSTSAERMDGNDALESPLAEPDAKDSVSLGARRIPSATESTARNVTTLHVEVVDASGAAITSGQLECDWSEYPKDGSGGHLVYGHVSSAISRAVTEVAIPANADRCDVTVSVSGHPAVRASASNLRQPARGAALVDGHVDHDVRVWLRAIDGPRISGAIFVNGVQRVPKGLRIAVDPTVAGALINVVDATYVLPMTGHPAAKELRAFSEESPYQRFNLPPVGRDGDQRLDLVLTSTRTLQLRVVDDATGDPAPGVDLSFNIQERTHDVGVRESSSFRSAHLTSDANGECAFRGMPDEGIVYVKETRDERSQLKPLLTLEVGARSPSELQKSVRVHVTRATVWGIAPEPPANAPRSTYQVFFARPLSDHEPVYRELSAPQDDRRRWSFDCEAPSEWLVWLARGGAIVSKVERVSVDRARTFGPIELAPLSMTAVNVRLIHLPSRGRVTAFVYELAGGPATRESFAFDSAELAIVLHVPGPVTAYFHCSASPRNSQTESTESLVIDPRAANELVVDMHGDHLRAIELRVNGSPPSGESVLSLVALADVTSFAGRSAKFALIDGKSDAPAPLPAGNYMYALASATDLGLIYGIATVVDIADPGVLKIDWSGKPVPRAKLGYGVGLVSVEGVSCANLKLLARQVLWRNVREVDAATLLVPDNCEYTVLR
jgi:hypothetical protein